MRQKGSPKFGGRKTGALNKTTVSLRSKVQLLIDDQWETIESDLKMLEPKERLSFLERLLKYVIPAPIPEPEEEKKDSKSKFQTIVDDANKKFEEARRNMQYSSFNDEEKDTSKE
jgi:hypothetical protein